MQTASDARARHPWKPALVAAADLAVLVAYLFLINSQSGPQNGPRIAFISAYLVLLALITSAGLLAAGSLRTAASSLLIASGAGNISLGVVAIFSVGLPLILAGLLLMTYPGLWPRSLAASVAPAVIMVILLIAGLLLTS